MLRRFGDRLSFTRKLGFRLGALLSVAILPLALISLVQNFNLVRSAERSVEIALLGRTTSAAAGERALLHSALGSADALGPGVLDLMEQPELCSELMRSFIQRSATYVAAAFVPMDGISNCTSRAAGTPIDFRDSDAYREFISEPGTLVTSLKNGPLSGRPVIAVVQPLYRDRELLGYVTLSLTYELLRSTHDMSLGTQGARIVTFNHRGQVLSLDGNDKELNRTILPQNTELVNLLSSSDTTFRARDNGGAMRVFTVVPIVPGLVYALGSWSPNTASTACSSCPVSARSPFRPPCGWSRWPWPISRCSAWFCAISTCCGVRCAASPSATGQSRPPCCTTPRPRFRMSARPSTIWPAS